MVLDRSCQTNQAFQKENVWAHGYSNFLNGKDAKKSIGSDMYHFAIKYNGTLKVSITDFNHTVFVALFT